jgi:hypothetical protein
VENCVVLPQGFKNFDLFDFVSAINLKQKKKTPSLVFDCVPMVSSTSPTGVVGGPVRAPAMQNMCPKHWQ